MQYIEIEIEQKQAKEGAGRRRKQPKGRAFSAALLAFVLGDALWNNTVDHGQEMRPLYALVAGTGEAMRAFVANVRAGRRAVQKVEPAYGAPVLQRWNWLRSVVYDFVPQRTPHGDLYQIAARRLVAEDPAQTDREECRYLLVTPAHWVRRQRASLAGDHNAAAAVAAHARALGLADPSGRGPLPPRATLGEEEVLDLAPVAARFMAYLDKRTRRPLPPRLDWEVHLLLAALRDGLASLAQRPDGHGRRRQEPTSDPADAWWWARHGWAEGCREWGVQGDFRLRDDGALLLPSIYVRASQERLDALLTREIGRFERLARGERAEAVYGEGTRVEPAAA